MQRSKIAFTICLSLAVTFVSSAALAQYQLTNLVSNQAGTAGHIDPFLVNASGIVHGPTTPFWISDNNAGWETLYNGTGTKVTELVVRVPPASGAAPGSPTGNVFNGSSDFQLQGDSAPFLWATLDGTIDAWSPAVNLASGIAVVNNSASGSMFTGLAITSHPSGNLPLRRRQCQQYSRCLLGSENQLAFWAAHFGAARACHFRGTIGQSNVSVITDVRPSVLFCSHPGREPR
jgi:hypothetical protein